MKKPLLLLIAFLVSLPFWVGINLLQTKTENFLYTRNISADMLKAQINQNFNNIKTLLNGIN